MEENKIIREYYINGIRILISDRSFCEKTEEELEIIRKNAQRTAWNIQRKQS